MNIVDMRGENAVRQEVARRLATHYINVHHIEPSALSAFTSMRLASHLKHQAAEVVIAARLKDVTGAASAHDLGYKFAIIFAPESRCAEDIPSQIPSKIADKIDLCVYDSEESQAAWNKAECMRSRCQIVIAPTTTLRPAKVDIRTTGSVDTNDSKTNPHLKPNIEKAETTTESQHETAIKWVGDIVHPEFLDHAVRAVSRIAEGVHLHVYGTGSAGRVMPVVKAARSLQSLKISWHGEIKNEDIPLTANDIMLQTDWSPTESQLAVMAAGIPLLRCSDAEQLKEDILAVIADPQKARLQALNTYKQRHELCFHVEQWALALSHFGDRQ